MKLTVENVSTIFFDCFFSEPKEKAETIFVEGVSGKAYFYPEKIERHRGNIVSMLAELPKEFRAESGGGWTFLNACTTSDGEQWTGVHLIVDYLVMLGIAIGKIEFQLPREKWSIFPGSVPYFVIK